MIDWRHIQGVLTAFTLCTLEILDRWRLGSFNSLMQRSWTESLVAVTTFDLIWVANLSKLQTLYIARSEAGLLPLRLKYLDFYRQ